MDHDLQWKTQVQAVILTSKPYNNSMRQWDSNSSAGISRAFLTQPFGKVNGFVGSHPDSMHLCKWPSTHPEIKAHPPFHGTLSWPIQRLWDILNRPTWKPHFLNPPDFATHLPVTLLWGHNVHFSLLPGKSHTSVSLRQMTANIDDSRVWKDILEQASSQCTGDSEGGTDAVS